MCCTTSARDNECSGNCYQCVFECLRAADFRWPKSLGVREETYKHVRGQTDEEAEYSCCGDNQGRSIGRATSGRGPEVLRRYFAVSGVVESDKIHRGRVRLNFFNTPPFQKVGSSISWVTEGDTKPSSTAGDSSTLASFLNHSGCFLKLLGKLKSLSGSRNPIPCSRHEVRDPGDSGGVEERFKYGWVWFVTGDRWARF
jgi:hypothetical protein